MPDPAAVKEVSTFVNHRSPTIHHLCSNNRKLYYMPLFRLPATVITRLEKMRNKFLWGDTGDTKKIV